MARGDPMTFPIPDAALDDRLGFVGTAGSGKTYNAGTGLERILASGGRVIVPDPLGVWWGLGLDANGRSPAPWREKLVVFGGEHGDMPLFEHSGALIGETVAGMAESAILDLSSIGTKAAERRFMLAFLTALYKHASNEPVHVIFDEADMWAPQRLLDKEGEAAKLLGMMETVVRRGRIRGFIPWLITQRPAVLSKDVLSQVDGLVAFKLTSSQDRDAIGAWIEGQADKEQGKAILGSLPTLPRGTGVVWLPGRGVLTTAAFPAKQTFDSSRTPTRGERIEKRELKPLNLEALRGKLASIEEEQKASDPRALKNEIRRLNGALADALAGGSAPTWPDQRELVQALSVELDEITAALEQLTASAAELQRRHKLAAAALGGERVEIPAFSPPQRRVIAPPVPVQRQAAPALREAQPEQNGELTASARKMIDTLARFYPRALTIEHITKVAGVSMKSSQWPANKRAFERSGLVEPFSGQWRISDAGVAEMGLQPAPDSPGDLLRFWTSSFTPSTAAMLRVIVEAGGQTVSRADLCERAGVSPTSSGVGGGLKELRDHELIAADGDGYYASPALLP
jgi:hypothetical protein